MGYGDRIRKARKAANLSQQQLGDECGVTKGAVSQWETEKTEPNLTCIKKICSLSGFSADYIVLGDLQPLELVSLAKKIEALAPEKRALLDLIFENKGIETHAFVKEKNPERR